MHEPRATAAILILFALSAHGCTPHHEHDAAVVDVSDRSDTDIAPPVAVPAPVIVAPPSPRAAPVPVDARSAVQLAPSFYPEWFSELRGERRSAHRVFNRRWPEARILRGDRALEDVTVLVLSRLFVSEANWIHDARLDRTDAAANHAELDAPAIFAVMRRTRRDGQTLLGAIRMHSHFVTEERPARGPRMRWIAELTLRGSRPAHFPATDSGGRPLNWSRDYLPRWLAVQAFTRELLEGEHLGACAAAPIITWGGRCDDPGGACDDSLAVARGLLPFDCGPTANRFWCRPRGDDARDCVDGVDLDALRVLELVAEYDQARADLDAIAID